MPGIRLTNAAIGRLRAPDPSGKQKLHWDSELRGLAVLCSGTTNQRSYVVQRTLPGGRTRRVTIGSVAEISLDKAREEAADLIHKMRHGEDPKAARKSAANWTLRDAMAAYIAARKDLKPETAYDYKREMERNLGAWLDRPLRSINGDLVEERHREIQAEVARRYRRPEHFPGEAGGHTANKCMNILGIIWNFVADRDESMPQNPTRRLRRQRYAEPRRERVLLSEQMPAFYRAVDALPNPVAADAVKLLLLSGLRRTEALELKWSEIDFASRTIRLPATRTKAKRRLDLPMTSHLRDLLVARRAIGVENGGWVFPGNGKIGNFTDLETIFKQIAEASGINLSAHDLRRTFLTVAESLDLSPYALKALVNHTLGSDVTSGYLQLTVERLREPAQRVADRIARLCEIEPPAGDNVQRIGAG